MGETLVLQNRPAEYVETRNETGAVLSITEGKPAQVTVYKESKDKTLPVLAALAAAYFLLS